MCSSTHKLVSISELFGSNYLRCSRCCLLCPGARTCTVGLFGTQPSWRRHKLFCKFDYKKLFRNSTETKWFLHWRHCTSHGFQWVDWNKALRGTKRYSGINENHSSISGCQSASITLYELVCTITWPCSYYDVFHQPTGVHREQQGIHTERFRHQLSFKLPSWGCDLHTLSQQINDIDQNILHV